MITITNDNYNDVLKSKPTIVIKVSASWCGPCKAYKPIFENFALKTENDEIGFAEADADEADQFVSEYRIKGVPATLIFKSGELVSKTVGNIDEAKLNELLHIN